MVRTPWPGTGCPDIGRWLRDNVKPGYYKYDLAAWVKGGVVAICSFADPADAMAFSLRFDVCPKKQ